MSWALRRFHIVAAAIIRTVALTHCACRGAALQVSCSVWACLPESPESKPLFLVRASWGLRWQQLLRGRDGPLMGWQTFHRGICLTKTSMWDVLTRLKWSWKIVKGKLLGGGGGQTHPPSHGCLAGPPWSTRGSPYRSRECRDMRKFPSGQTDFSKIFVSFVFKLESVVSPRKGK